MALVMTTSNTPVSTDYVSYKKCDTEKITNSPIVPKDVTIKDEKSGQEMKLKKWQIGYRYDYNIHGLKPVIDGFFLNATWITSEEGLRCNVKGNITRWSIMFKLNLQDAKQLKLYEVLSAIFTRRAKILDDVKDQIGMSDFDGADMNMAEKTKFKNFVFRPKEKGKYVEGISPVFFAELSTSKKHQTLFTLPTPEGDKPEIVEWSSLVSVNTVMKPCFYFCFDQSFKGEIRTKIFLSSAVVGSVVPCGSQVRNIKSAHHAAKKGKFNVDEIRENIRLIKELNSNIPGKPAEPAPTSPGSETPSTSGPSFGGLSDRPPQQSQLSQQSEQLSIKQEETLTIKREPSLPPPFNPTAVNLPNNLSGGYPASTPSGYSGSVGQVNNLPSFSQTPAPIPTPNSSFTLPTNLEGLYQNFNPGFTQGSERIQQNGQGMYTFPAGLPPNSTSFS